MVGALTPLRFASSPMVMGAMPPRKRKTLNLKLLEVLDYCHRSDYETDRKNIEPWSVGLFSVLRRPSRAAATGWHECRSGFRRTPELLPPSFINGHRWRGCCDTSSVCYLQMAFAQGFALHLST